MTKDQFKSLQVGQELRHHERSTIISRICDYDYDYSTQPATRFPYMIEMNDGTNLKIIDNHITEVDIIQ